MNLSSQQYRAWSLSILRFAPVTLLSHFIRKALHSLTSAPVISTFSVRIETAAIVFLSFA